VTIAAESGHMVPVTGSPMVLKLIGPDGTTTEGLGAEHGTPGTYTATIRVPSSGISSAVFGIRGTGTAANGTTSIEDLAFDVDGLLFTTTPHVARSTTSSTSGTTTTAAPDFGPAAAAGVALAIVAAGVIVLIGRRRRMGYA
jgi:carbohydrate-binding DOMON domain-containing protein